jgi:dienelactone hydrolase
MYALLQWYYVNRIGICHPRVKCFFEALRQANTEIPIGAAGFCWCGKHVVLLAGDKVRVNGKPLFDAGFTGHPSLLSMPDDIENMEIPVEFAIGDKDAHLTMEMIRSIQQIAENMPDERKGEVKIYSNCGYCFCIRAYTTFLDRSTSCCRRRSMYCVV